MVLKVKVLIANPPWYKGDMFGVRAGSRWPHFQEGPYLPFPFFMAYSASLLETNDKEVLAIDCIAEKLKEEGFIKKLKDFSPDLLLMEVSTPSIYSDLALAEEIKSSFPSIKIAFSGPHVLMHDEKFLDEYIFIDYILFGEYEYTLLELVECLEQNGDLKNISGLIYRGTGGKCEKNPSRALISDLDQLPWPARHFFPIQNYCDLGYGVPQPSLQLWASRGCPFGCNFCFWPQVMYGGRQYRVRDAKEILKEIKFCIEKYDLKSYFFDDDTFNIGKDRIIQIASEIKKNNINLPWAAMSRADTMDFEMLDSLYDSGLRGIKYGVESGVQEIVDRAGKSLDLKKVEEIVSYTKKLGIHVHLTFTFGLPGETKDSVNKTIDFALELNPDSLQFSIMTPFPGSKYFQELDEKGCILTKDWSKYDGSSNAVMKTEELEPKDLEKAVEKATELWKTHVYKRSFNDKKLYYIKKGLANPYKAIKAIKNILLPRKD